MSSSRISEAQLEPLLAVLTSFEFSLIIYKLKIQAGEEDLFLLFLKFLCKEVFTSYEISIIITVKKSLQLAVT